MGEKIIDGKKAGKEANSIDEQVLNVGEGQDFIDGRSVYDSILNLTP